GFATAENVPGEADARGEVVAVGFLAGVGEADAVKGIAYEKEARGRAGDDRGMHAGGVGVGAELLGAAVDLLHHALRLIAEAECESEVVADFPRILEVE